MEDPRISRMYLAMLERSLFRALGRFRTGAWLRSPMIWISLLILALVGAGIAMHEKGRGHLHQIKADLGTAPPPAPAPAAQPGGQAAIQLRREPVDGALSPEFLSATLLPGRGMNVLQITAFVPGKGEVPLLDSPSLSDAARIMAGTEGDVNGEQSLAIGGAIEAPWAGTLYGAGLPGGDSIMVNWHGRGLTLPVIIPADQAAPSATGVPSTTGGLLLRRPADTTSSPVMPDGGEAQATFRTGNFRGRWPSATDISTNVLLDGRVFALTITATNSGNEPEPMSIGWRPRFALPRGERDQMRLRLPSRMDEEVANHRPTGKLLPVTGTNKDFSAPGGTPLGTIDLDDTFVHLQQGSLSIGPEVELRDPADGYGLRMTILTPSIKAIHVVAPANQSSIILAPQSSYDDAFGREWDKDEDTGLVILQPGQSMQWKVRLELFPLAEQLPQAQRLSPP